MFHIYIKSLQSIGTIDCPFSSLQLYTYYYYYYYYHHHHHHHHHHQYLLNAGYLYIYS